MEHCSARLVCDLVASNTVRDQFEDVTRVRVHRTQVLQRGNVDHILTWVTVQQLHQNARQQLPSGSILMSYTRAIRERDFAIMYVPKISQSTNPNSKMQLMAKTTTVTQKTPLNSRAPSATCSNIWRNYNGRNRSGGNTLSIRS